MKQRWRQLRCNAGRVDMAKIVLFLPVTVALVYTAFEGVERLIACGGMIAGFVAPYLISDFLVRHVKGLMGVGHALVALWVLALLFGRGVLLALPGIPYVVVLVLACLVGAIFWTYSDPRVRIE